MHSNRTADEPWHACEAMHHARMQSAWHYGHCQPLYRFVTASSLLLPIGSAALTWRPLPLPAARWTSRRVTTALPSVCASTGPFTATSTSRAARTVGTGIEQQRAAHQGQLLASLPGKLAVVARDCRRWLWPLSEAAFLAVWLKSPPHSRCSSKTGTNDQHGSRTMASRSCAAQLGAATGRAAEWPGAVCGQSAGHFMPPLSGAVVRRRAAARKPLSDLRAAPPPCRAACRRQQLPTGGRLQGQLHVQQQRRDVGGGAPIRPAPFNPTHTRILGPPAALVSRQRRCGQRLPRPCRSACCRMIRCP